jgi:hypothetical protein
MSQLPMWSTLPMEIWHQILLDVPVGTIIELGAELSLFDRFCETPRFWEARTRTKLGLTSENRQILVDVSKIGSLPDHPMFQYISILCLILIHHLDFMCAVYSKYMAILRDHSQASAMASTSKYESVASDEITSIKLAFTRTIQQMARSPSSSDVTRYYMLKSHEMFKGVTEYLDRPIIFAGSNQAQVYLKIQQYLRGRARPCNDLFDMIFYFNPQLCNWIQRLMKSRRCDGWNEIVRLSLQSTFEHISEYSQRNEHRSFWIQEYRLADTWIDE